MKMRNFVREKLAACPYVLGAFASSGSAMNCECLGVSGMDFVIVDAEHAQTDAESIVDMIRACEAYQMSAFVRVYDPDDYAMMARLLDVGAHGIMVPMVESREQAERILAAVKYPPMGNRGASKGRGARWGMYENYASAANQTLYTILQCESQKGVKQIGEICQTPGIDCVFVGTADLCQDMGCPGDVSHPEVSAAIAQVLSSCRQYGVVPGIVTGSREEAAMRIKQGFSFVTCMNDQVFFRVRSSEYLRQIREELKGVSGAEHKGAL